MQVTPWGRGFEKVMLLVVQMPKTFSVRHGNRIFITTFTRLRRWTVS